MDTDGPQRWGSESDSGREHESAPDAGSEHSTSGPEGASGPEGVSGPEGASEETPESAAGWGEDGESGGGAVFGPGGGGPGRGWRRNEKWSARKKLVVCATAALAGLIVLIGIGITMIWNHLNGNIRTQGADLKSSSVNGKQDVLFIGSDSRAGANQALGGGSVAGARSDTTMIFDSPADRRKGTEVSIPRDSMVQIPACTGSGGQSVAAGFGMFNSAFTTGGAPCTVSTVQSLTGLPLTHYIVVDFEGVVGVVNALGGVKVCVSQPISDPDSGLRLAAGTTTLNGRQALAFVRVRHTIGDGSDLERIQRQQYFIDQLSSQVRADGLLTDPVKLYKVLNAATSAIQTDPGLGSVSQLYGLAETLNSIPSGKMTYVTVPNEPYAGDPNRVVWSEPAATKLWDSLINEPDAGPAAATGAAQGLRPAGPLPSAVPNAAQGLRAGPLPSVGTAAPGAKAAQALTPDQVRAAESLGAFESVMRLALMADTPSGTTTASGSPSAAASDSGSGTTTPGGVDTCPIS